MQPARVVLKRGDKKTKTKTKTETETITRIRTKKEAKTNETT